MSRTLSRRSFLHDTALMSAEVFIAGVAPAVVPPDARAAQDARRQPADSTGRTLTHAAAEADVAAGPKPVALTLRVNGADRTLQAEPRMTLAEALRGPLGLTGTKIGCNRGACSACTVWLDGAPVCACMTLAVDAERHSITTIEGLAQGETLHPVQTAFIEHDALQCGFCTPGMVMSCAALMERTHNPLADDVKTAISGHFCRCGTYPHVVASHARAGGRAQGAMMSDDAATRSGTFPAGIASVGLREVTRGIPSDEPPPLAPNAELAVIGKPVVRHDARAKVTGAARFTVDVNLPGMLSAKILRSPYAHARVRGIDITAAARHPGVREVLVVTTPDDPAQGVVRYVGMPVAAVAATSLAVADEALRLIRVDYEPLPFVVDLDAARRADAPRIYDRVGIVNLFGKRTARSAEAKISCLTPPCWRTKPNPKPRWPGCVPRVCVAHSGCNGTP
ncbi:2Fe-2S iron-sulfur cluster-binding protein [Burkholderia pyrrocinia]|uniref:2Fe-2S iron-sulfur cluster-binding protein n=1 Tax=Burkholderia pyrrocinia TaxID=60550 RepID=UPI0015885458|nr:2Fe-2S iron-sulfur cluster-binding protein [Burkholderia pyrrocinia]